MDIVPHSARYIYKYQAKVNWVHYTPKTKDMKHNHVTCGYYHSSEFYVYSSDVPTLFYTVYGANWEENWVFVIVIFLSVATATSGEVPAPNKK